MSNKPVSFKAKKEAADLERLVQMTEGAQRQYFAEKAAKIQPFTNENEKAHLVKNSAINAVVLAEIQCNGTPAIEDQPAVLAKCLAMATAISDAQLKRRWEEFKECLVEMREHETHPAMVWAADRAGVDISAATLKELIKATDTLEPPLNVVPAKTTFFTEP